MKRSVNVFLFSWFCSLVLHAQTSRLSIATTFDETLEVCETPITFSVQVTNTSGVTLYNTVLNPKMPVGMKYVSASLSSSPSGVTLLDVNDYNDPDFGIGSLAPSASVTVTFTATAGCAVIATLGTATELSNATQVSYTLTSSTTPIITEFEASGSNTYNVAYASLGLAEDPASELITAHKGTTVSRKLKISNTGTGKLSALVLKVAYGGSLNFSDIKINGTSATTTGTLISREVAITDFSVASSSISGNSGDGDAYLEEGEYFYVEDIALITACGQFMPTNYSVEWGCGGSICNLTAGGTEVNNNSKATCDVSTYVGAANITSSYESSEDLLPLCSSGTDLVHVFTNIGTTSSVEGDRALDVSISVSHYTIPLSNYKMWNYGSSSYVTMPSSVFSTASSTEDVITFANNTDFSTDIDGPGGLDDLDGDGYYDDLAKGETIKIQATYSPDCPAMFENNCNSVLSIGQTIYPRWINNCGVIEFNYANGIAESFSSSLYLSSIAGPADLADEDVYPYEFKVNRGFSVTSIFKCSLETSAFVSVIQLPLGYTCNDDKVQWKDQSGNITELDYTIVDGVMTISGGGWTGSYIINFQLDCDEVSSGSLSSEMSWSMYYYCNSSCPDCGLKIVCTTKTVYNHCIDCEGFATTSFSVDRTSMGWEDPASGQVYTEANFSSQNGNVPVHRLTYTEALAENALSFAENGEYKYRLSAAYEYDTLLAVAKGILTGSSFSNAHVEIYFSTPYPLSNGVSAPLDVLDASFLIKDVSASTETSCTGIVPVVTQTSGDGYNYNHYTYDFEVPGSCVASFDDGDMIDLTVHFRVKSRTQNYLPVGQHELIDFRANHYGTKIIEGVPEKQSCQSFGDDMTIIAYQPGFVNFAPETSYDVTEMRIGFYHDDGVRIIVDDFPNEVRPYAKIQEIYYDMPDHWSFARAPINETGTGLIGKYFVMRNSLSLQPGPVIEITAPTLTGRRYKWIRDKSWPVYKSQDLGYGSLMQYEFFQFNLQRDCSVGRIPSNGTIYVKYSTYDYTGNLSVITNSSFIAQDKSSWFTSFDYSNANFSLDLQATQEGVSPEVSWEVNLCSGTTVAYLQPEAVDNVWLAVEPSMPNINFTKAIDLAEGSTMVYMPSEYGASGSNKKMFQIGHIDKNTCKNLKLVAEYTSCVTDQVDAINVYSNWSFNGTQTARETADCLHPLQSATTHLRYKNAALDPELTKLNDEVQDICDPAVFELKLESTAYADMSDLKLKMILPDGITLADPAIEADLPALPASPSYNPLSCTDNNFEWNFSTCAPLTDAGKNPVVYGNGTGGLIGAQRDAVHNTYLAKINLNIGCDYDPANPVEFKVSGETNCGDQIAGGLNNFSRKIRINGLDPLDQMGVDIMASPFPLGSDETTVTVTVANNGASTLYSVLPDVDRYLVVILPPHLDMVSGSCTPSAPTTTETLSDGSTKYSWLLPSSPGLGASSSVNYSFQVKNNGVEIEANTENPCASGVAELPVTAVVEMRKELTCAETTCQGKATTATDTDFIRFWGEDPNCPCITSFAPERGKKYVLSAWVNASTGGEQVTTYTDGAVYLAFAGTSTTFGPFYPKGEIIDGWQRIDTVFTVPMTALNIQVKLHNGSAHPVYFDDIRIHPFNANMKSYVYDPFSLRLKAELDENNYATIYEYDEEGGLVRVKKETERGVMTIRESRTSVKKP